MTRKCQLIIFIFSIIFFQLFSVHAQNNYKSDLVKALSFNDFPAVERIISDHAGNIPESEKRLIYAFSLDYCHKNSALAILQLLHSHEIYPSVFDLFNALNRSHSDEVIQFILHQGITPNGEILLFAAEKKRFNLVNQFAAMGADVNYQYPPGRAYSNGMTALMYAVREGNFETVSILTEQGAEVNTADKNGYTPASLSKEMGLTEIYDYLIAHGAADAEPPKISEDSSPSSTNNVSAENAGQGIASLIDGSHQIILRGGSYRLAGSTTEIIIPRDSSMGAFSYTKNGIPMMGACRIDQRNLIIMMEGKTYTYTIDSESSFSGYGERWIRINN